MKLTYELWLRMVSTPNGGISSTRVLAWDTWQFTKKFLIGEVLLVLALMILKGFEYITFETTMLQYLLGTLGSITLLLFTAMYAPKQFSKTSEMRAIMSLPNDEKEKAMK